MREELTSSTSNVRRIDAATVSGSEPRWSVNRLVLPGSGSYALVGLVALRDVRTPPPPALLRQLAMELYDAGDASVLVADDEPTLVAESD